MDHDENSSGQISTIPHAIGKVGSPSGKEATSDQFYFWVDRNSLVEVTQIVRTSSVISGQTYTFYALVEQTFRVSDKSNIADEYGSTDGNSEEETTLKPEGVSYASARILRTMPNVFTAPLEQSKVYLCTDAETELAYGADENGVSLTLGKIKNGGDVVSGSGQIDMDYLLGVNGGHMNVNGVAGRGTKSSFLLFTTYMLLREAEKQAIEQSGKSNRLKVVPIILNVKGFDLFFIDHQNKGYDPAKDAQDWHDLGVDDPKPFQGVKFFAPQMPTATTPIPTGRTGDVTPYSWSLSDIIEKGLLMFVFASEDAEDYNFSALVLDIEDWMTEDTTLSDGTVQRKLRSNIGSFPKKGEKKKGGKKADSDDDGEPVVDELPYSHFDPEIVPQNFDELSNWVKEMGMDVPPKWSSHHPGTWRKLHRRLIKLLHEGNGVIRRSDHKGAPLNLVNHESANPIVIDLNGLSKVPSLQRFVVATIFNQLLEDRTGPSAVNGLVYLVGLDELNRFAPRGAKDPITKLIETVAAEMRSAGIILLGAQQQASKISERVFENSAIRVLGRSGSLEMSQPIWRFLTDKMRSKAGLLQANEKLLIQDSFLEPMHVRVPFPVWAMRREDAVSAPNVSSGGKKKVGVII
jgi:uncharacterized protein